MGDPRTMAGLGALMQAFALQAIPEDTLARIDAPTTLVWGRQDLATPLVTAEDGERALRLGAEVIDDCADEPPMERPEPFRRRTRAGDRPDGGDPMTAMDIATADTLRRTPGGSLLRPADAGFAESTLLWNAMIDKTPALVVQPTDTADVAAAVDFARLHGMPLAVRGGGHNIAGTALADGGVTIDMSRLRSVGRRPRRARRDRAARLPARRRRPRRPRSTASPRRSASSRRSVSRASRSAAGSAT